MLVLLRKRDRKRLLMAANGWLAAARESADTGALLAQDVTRVLGAVGPYADVLGEDLELAHALGWLHWLRSTVLPDGQGEAELRSALAWFDALAEVRPDSIPELAVVLLADTGDILEEALASQDATELDRAIDAIALIAAQLPAGHRDLPGAWTNLGVALQERFERDGDSADIDAAVQFNQLALDGVADDDPRRVMYLTNIGAAFLTRFERDRVIADLGQAIMFLRQASEVSDLDDPELPTCLSNLSAAYLARFRHDGRAADLDEAILYAEQAVGLDRDLHGQRQAVRLRNLALVRMARFEAAGSQTDLDEAIRAREQAIAALPADESAGEMANLGETLRLRFERTQRPADLEQAVEWLRRAVAAVPQRHPARVTSLSNLGIALQARFERTDSPDDLAAALSAGAEAVAESDGHPQHAAILANQCSALRMRFERYGTWSDLEEAVRVAERAVAADPDQAAAVSNLAVCLRMRFNHTGVIGDLDAAIDLGRRAAMLVGNNADAAVVLTGLSAALRIRFEHKGEMADVDAAIVAGRQAIAATAEQTSVSAETFEALANASQARYARTRERRDLEVAVAAAQAAVDALPQWRADQGRFLSNLAVCSLTRFRLSGQPSDLERAIDAAQQSCAATADGHPNRARLLSNLALALKERFTHAGRLEDLDGAIRVMGQAVTLTPDEHPDLAGMLTNFSNLLLTRFQSGGDQADLTEAANVGRHGAGVRAASAMNRMKAALAWAEACAAAGEWAGAADAYTAAIGLMSRVSPRGLRRDDHEGLLAALPSLATDAAACCVRAGMAQRAVELFEHGRGVLLGYALDARTDLTAVRPDLSERFLELCDAIEHSGTAGGVEPSLGTRGPYPADSFDELIEQIRRLPGLENFLAPSPIDRLREAARGGVVVILNTSRYGSDALIVTKDGVLDPLPLPGLSLESLHSQALTCFGAVGGWSRSEGADPEKQLMEVLAWLWDTVTGPVLERLEITGPPRTGPDGQPTWPRLWWCPSYLLSFLPLHASGHHDQTGASVLDRVVSSYTPTLRALWHTRQSGPSGSLPGPGQLVAVAMSHTPGLGSDSDLPGVDSEIEMLRDLYPGSLEVLSGASATRSAVLDALPAARWAHFACHAHSDLRAPSDSRLLLADWSTRPFTVTDLARLRLADAELAFLSACSTGRGGLTLPDEAIHLASAVQLAGFRHTISTLWAVEDRSAAAIARDTYRRLSINGTADQAALALHTAVRAQRTRTPETPSRWAAHIHVGT